MAYLSEKELVSVLSLVLIPGFTLVLHYWVRDRAEGIVDSFKLKNQAGHFASGQSVEVDDGGFLYVVHHDCCVDELLVTITFEQWLFGNFSSSGPENFISSKLLNPLQSRWAFWILSYLRAANTAGRDALVHLLQ